MANFFPSTWLGGAWSCLIFGMKWPKNYSQTQGLSATGGGACALWLQQHSFSKLVTFFWDTLHKRLENVHHQHQILEHCWYKSGVSEQEFYVKGQVENQELASLVSAMWGIWIPGGFLRVDQRQLVRTVDQRRSYAHTDTQVMPGWFVPTCRQYLAG